MNSRSVEQARIPMIVVTPALPSPRSLPLEMREALNAVSPAAPISLSFVHGSSNRSLGPLRSRSAIMTVSRKSMESNIIPTVSLATKEAQGARRRATRTNTTLIHARRVRQNPLIWIEASRTGRFTD